MGDRALGYLKGFAIAVGHDDLGDGGAEGGDVNLDALRLEHHDAHPARASG